MICVCLQKILEFDILNDMKLKTIFVLGLVAGMMSCSTPADYCPVTASGNDLVFPALAQSWDEGIPLGNATVGALVWEKDTEQDRVSRWFQADHRREAVRYQLGVCPPVERSFTTYLP